MHYEGVQRITPGDGCRWMLRTAPSDLRSSDTVALAPRRADFIPLPGGASRKHEVHSLHAAVAQRWLPRAVHGHSPSTWQRMPAQAVRHLSATMAQTLVGASQHPLKTR